MAEENNQQQVLVVGAGPAGLFASRKLAEEGAQVVLLNRDIKPGGLAEYGIYYEKYKIKEGLRNQFRQIMAMPEITYIGNVTVGNDGDITLDELRTFGFDAILVTVGAQGTKWLELPGEELTGVYHAKDIVYHYNKLPPFSTRDFKVRGRVAMVGVGNVMMDIAHWAIRDLKVDEVIAVARRGPAEVKFTEKEMEHIIGNLDVSALDTEVARCTPSMQAVNQDAQAARKYILSALPNGEKPVSATRLRFDFLASPTRIIGNDRGQVIGLEVEDNKLVPKGDDTKVVGLGVRRVLDVDTVVYCIGDKVDENFGLPIQGNEFVKNPHPIYPIDGISYEAYDPEQDLPLEGVFVAGWSRQASSGLVGLARKDGENGVKAMLEYLKKQAGTNTNNTPIKYLEKRLLKNKKPLIRKENLVQLDLYELSQMQELGLKDFKLNTNEEMLTVIN